MKNIDRLLVKAMKINAISRKKKIQNMTNEELDEHIRHIRLKLGIGSRQYKSHDFYTWLQSRVRLLRSEANENSR